MKALRPLFESLLIHGLILALFIPVTRSLSASEPRSLKGMMQINFDLSGTAGSQVAIAEGGAGLDHSEAVPAVSPASVVEASQVAASGVEQKKTALATPVKPAVTAESVAKITEAKKVEPQPEAEVRAVVKEAETIRPPEPVVSPQPESEHVVAEVSEAVKPQVPPPVDPTLTPQQISPDVYAQQPTTPVSEALQQEESGSVAEQATVDGSTGPVSAPGTSLIAGALANSSQTESLAGLNGTEPGLPAAGGDEIEGYRQANYGAIRNRIHDRLNYPGLARRRGWSGRIEVLFRVATDGSLIDAEIVRSSGYPLLDRQALKAIKKAAPFSPPPQIAQFRMPVVFQLN